MEYRIMSDDVLSKLIERVNIAIIADWIPQGGVSVAKVGRGVSYFQAMLHIEKTEGGVV